MRWIKAVLNGFSYGNAFGIAVWIIALCMIAITIRLWTWN